MYEYMNNRCVTQAGCHRKLPVKSTLQDEKMLWKAFQGKCHYDCPDGYQEGSIFETLKNIKSLSF